MISAGKFCLTFILKQFILHTDNRPEEILMTLHLTDLTKIRLNSFDIFGKEWGLLTVGTADSFNTMTIAWGQLGFMWKKNVITVVVRPQRYTFEFMEKHPDFTVSFFGNAMREVLQLCGSKSGRDINKIAESGLTPRVTENGIFFEEASLVFCAKTIYKTRSEYDSFSDKTIPDEIYQKKDFHHWYTGEITAVLEK
jgi:flavin reductase (DIM6/NTAB) family NADH-FMN oxidoreductase RutF